MPTVAFEVNNPDAMSKLLEFAKKLKLKILLSKEVIQDDLAYWQNRNAEFEAKYKMKFKEFEKMVYSKPNHTWEEDQIIMDWEPAYSILHSKEIL
jgi:hypothetical protein